MTIPELQYLRESEDKVEFKEAKNNFPYNGGSHKEQENRRKCYLGYIVALANEGGGKLIFGMDDSYPHNVVGSNFVEGKLGELEDGVYEKLEIRVRLEELFDENGLRVLVSHIPSRPIGKMLKFEGVPLMRVGDSLRNMSDEEMFAILSEQEPDFSAKIVKDFSLEDIDDEAFSVLKDSYTIKQRNPLFAQLSKTQILSDLKLNTEAGFNYACLILLAKKEALNTHLPQCKIIWEYRSSESQIHFDNRIVIDEPLYKSVDQVWKLINQPLLNKKHPIQNGAYIYDIYDFNEAVLREAILNAVAHRDYSIASEVVIKQFPSKIIISNPGGFPKGVSIENILTVSSTPRSRLLTDILEKTGLVERSGQGVDKIFSLTLSEGKPEPDYSFSDMFQVTLILYSQIADKAFHIFINEYQHSDKEPKLGVEQIITLYKVRKGIFANLKENIVTQLLSQDLVRPVSTHTNRYILADDFHKLEGEMQLIGKKYVVTEVEMILFILQGRKMKIGEIEQYLKKSLNRNQIKYLLSKLKDDDILITEGVAGGTKYFLTDSYKDFRGELLVNTVIEDLRLKL
ncbi:ATP-binding protein [Epilithonimonas hispanica]|uniref:AAA family ATPase n=1 Tax=Epilithonimonas hispanica TaxID=358687 RepID=A0A3D9CKF7_9FLAO|nr:ATP-binding protein [Epilithonimonas hispanica]REC66218.1 AAA family ATPase [Epilithonimonas hispanica]